MDIYDLILDGLRQIKPTNVSIEEYLQQLKDSVRFLRKAYYAYPVHVPYEKKEIQAAYLIAYTPHYYQLIYSILNNEKEILFKDKTKLNLGFIGGGPGSEVYGTLKYILNNCLQIKEVNVYIFDLNAQTWKFSHDIVLNNLIKKIAGAEKISINWNARTFNLIKEEDLKSNESIIKQLDLIVVQNCINEVAPGETSKMISLLKSIYNLLPGDSYFLISDLTTSVRNLMKSIESDILQNCTTKYHRTTLNQYSPEQVISVHAYPNKLIRENLLNNTDGLIPRKNLKYDYLLIARPKVETQEAKVEKATGFGALYSPLENNLIDANDYVHTKTFIGLDFGTSTTVLSFAVLKNEKIEVQTIPVTQKSRHVTAREALVPSVMGIYENQFMVGKYAEERKGILDFGKNIWYGFKENLEKLHEIFYPESVLKNNDKVRISNAKEALVYFFKYLKAKCDEFLSENNLPKETEFSVTVPAAFDYEKKQALRACLIEAGISYQDAPFIEEPTAAIINYFFESKDPVSLGEKPIHALILDIGAGTVDVSIMELNKEAETAGSKLLAVSRQGEVGGNFLDELMAIKIIGGKEIYDRIAFSERKEILKNCENLKIKICKEVITDATVNYRLSNNAESDSALQITAIDALKNRGIDVLSMRFSEFMSLMRTYWTYIETTLKKAYDIADLKNDDVDLVILNGGGCRNPYMQNFARNFFIKSKIVRPDNIQEHVSKGAALNSFVLNSYGKQIVASVMSESLESSDGSVTYELIPAGETLPSSEVEIGLNKSVREERGCIELIHNKKSVFFELESVSEIVKLVISVNIDNEPECVIVYPNKTADAKRMKIPNSKPLKIYKL